MSKVKGFFITGTDTGVGKTVVTCALYAFLRQRGHSVTVFKPIETGCEKTLTGLRPNDASLFKELLSLEEELDVINPVRFEQPLAPMVAAEIEGRAVDLGLIRATFNKVQAKHRFILVEGIGGIMVPITYNYFLYDLIREFQLPVIIVARNALGMINHTLLTCDFAVRAGLKPAGIIINNPSDREPDIAQRTNANALRQVVPVPIICNLPYIEQLSYTSLLKAIKGIEDDIISVCKGGNI
ncbi:MAG: dethiobiotin synthase [Candidatus Magnetoovum sp. WYHC-5]|nr:dethiobiotin synthase [Candidatus Magnetoovum sp. WYHC-5]